MQYDMHSLLSVILEFIDVNIYVNNKYPKVANNLKGYSEYT